MAARVPGATVVAADTLVAIDGRVLGHPLTPIRPASISSGFAAAATKFSRVSASCVEGERSAKACVLSSKCGPTPMARFNAQLRTAPPLYKAGGYAIQDADFHPVGSFRGCYCNVVGLPLWTLHAMLLEAGLTQDIRTPEGDRPSARPAPAATKECRPELKLACRPTRSSCFAARAGSGKSSFAREHFRATQVVSTDALRAMVFDDEADQGASGAAFSLLRIILKHGSSLACSPLSIQPPWKPHIGACSSAQQPHTRYRPWRSFSPRASRLACHATTCAGVASILKSLPVNMSSFGRRCSAHSARDGAAFSCFHRTGRRLWTLDRRGDQRLAVADPSETPLNREPVRAAPRLPAAGRLDQKPCAAGGTADDSDARAHRQ